MSIKPSGAEPSDTIKFIPKEKIQKWQPKEIKVYNPPKQVHGEHAKRNPSMVKLETKKNSPMKENLANLPDNVKNNLTPEMKADIEAGITTKDFIDKYIQNIGL